MEFHTSTNISSPLPHIEKRKTKIEKAKWEMTKIKNSTRTRSMMLVFLLINKFRAPNLLGYILDGKKIVQASLIRLLKVMLNGE